MAKMIDQKPTFHGEAKVWDAFNSYLPNNIIVYNNREINGREFDYCLFIENVGVLIVEVKGWLADKISVQGVDNIIVDGYKKPQRSPKKQARAYKFALLNKIVEKYNTSPLVFDMVCYPFITKAEYHISHLDIVSEEQFTIFKEDLENTEALLAKLQQGYDASKLIPHADFSLDLMNKLRQRWEPDFVQHRDRIDSVSKPYSILSVHSGEMSLAEIDQITSEYFLGIKRVVFVDKPSTYQAIISAFNNKYKATNIQPSGNKLSLGYKKGLLSGATSTRAFNLEIYLVNDLHEYCSSKFDIEEGHTDAESDAILKKLGAATTFNYQQFLVEHAPTENNTLVEAGAGTGKTFSMVSRVAYLCNKKVGAVSNIADEVAMVTFTNDAADNMKVRLKQMFVNYFVLTSNPLYLKFVEDTDRAHISTIHSFALSILRNEVLYTGLGTNFRISSNEYMREKIYDELLSSFLANMEGQNSNFVNEIPVHVYDLKKKVISVADRLLAKSVDLKQIKSSEMGVTVDNTIPYFNELIEKTIIPAEEIYSENTHLSNRMDLKECIILLEKVLKQLPGKLESLSLRYMFIDDFQDTDDVQIRIFQMLQKLMNEKCRLFVVGDLKQSIYRFRGAKLSAFTQLMENSLYDWNTYHLTINYRTDYRLLDKFDAVFSHMGDQQYLPYKEDDRLSSCVFTDAEDENLFMMVPCHAKDEEQFAESFVNVLNEQISQLNSIMQKRAENNQPTLSKEERTIAILVRSNWQVDKIVMFAKSKGLKVRIKSGGDLYQLPSSIDLYKLVLALNNASNPVYMVNLIESNYIGLVLDYQKYHGLDLKARVDDLTRVLDEFFMVRTKKTWQQIVNEAYTQPILYVLKLLYDALQPWKQYSHNTLDQKHYMVNYEYLMERIIKYARVDTLTLNQVVEYLRVCILTGQHQLSREIDVAEDDIQLICTTIHKSKGLEYGTVILPYTYDDISDIQRVKLDANYSDSKLAYTVLFENKVREHNSNYDESFEINEQISEESRILYVALTRAIRNCVWIKNIDSNPIVSWGSLMEE